LAEFDRVKRDPIQPEISKTTSRLGTTNEYHDPAFGSRWSPPAWPLAAGNKFRQHLAASCNL
jgi:hypothetical protein